MGSFQSRSKSRLSAREREREREREIIKLQMYQNYSYKQENHKAALDSFKGGSEIKTRLQQNLKKRKRMEKKKLQIYETADL